MAINLDRFGGAEAWDAYCNDQDREYQRLIADKVCADCGNFDRSPDGRSAVCWEHRDFIDPSDYPADLECEYFEEAA